MSEKHGGHSAVLTKLNPTPKSFLVELAGQSVNGTLPFTYVASGSCNSIVNVLLRGK